MTHTLTAQDLADTFDAFNRHDVGRCDDPFCR